MTAPHTYVVEGGFETDQSQEAVWKILTDYPNVPKFSPSLKSSEVSSREGRQVFLTQKGTARFLFFTRSFEMRMKVLEAPPARLDFEELSHLDFKSYRGYWETSRKDGTTLVRYRLEAYADFGPWVNWLAKDYILETASESLELLKKEISSRTP